MNLFSKIILLFFIFIYYAHADIGNVYHCKSQKTFKIIENEAQEYNGQIFTMKLNEDKIIFKGNDYFQDDSFSVDTTYASNEFFTTSVPGLLSMSYNKGKLVFVAYSNNDQDITDEVFTIVIIADCKIV